MTGKTIIKQAMEEKKYSYAVLAEALKFKYPSNVSEMVRSTNMRIDNFVKLLTAMKYDIVVMDGNNKKWKVTLTDESPNEEEK